MSKERPLAVRALPEQEVAMVESLLILAETGTEFFPTLDVEVVVTPPLTKDVARVSDLAGSLGTGVEP